MLRVNTLDRKTLKFVFSLKFPVFSLHLNPQPIIFDKDFKGLAILNLT